MELWFAIMVNRKILIIVLFAVSSAAIFVALNYRAESEIEFYSKCDSKYFAIQEKTLKLTKAIPKIRDVIDANEDFIPINFREGLCVAELNEKEDGMLDCFIVSRADLDGMMKICFAPLGTLWSFEYASE